MLNNKIIYAIHKYGLFVHFLLFIFVMWVGSISAKSPMFWALFINNMLIVYYSWIGGTCFGINNTVILLANKTKNETNLLPKLSNEDLAKN